MVRICLLSNTASTPFLAPDDCPGLLCAFRFLAVNAAHKLGTINEGTMNEQPGLNNQKMDEGNMFSSNSSVGSFSLMSCSPL
jgi:hypothetical protein